MDDGKLAQPSKSSYSVPGEVYAPPADETVQISDDVEGSGPEAKSGDTVTMSYRGTLEDGSEFDAADKFDFEIDEGCVIRGWDMGIKVRRECALSPSQLNERPSSGHESWWLAHAHHPAEVSYHHHAMF